MVQLQDQNVISDPTAFDEPEDEVHMQVDENQQSQQDQKSEEELEQQVAEDIYMKQLIQLDSQEK